nr:hypothetical protein [Tanacetum cinerariifolium]
MKMEILLEPTSNKLMVAGNPVKEILLKLNLPDHRTLKDGGEDDRDQNSTWELFSYREDNNEVAFAVAVVDKIYAHELLTFNNTVTSTVAINAVTIAMAITDSIHQAKGNIHGLEIIRDQSGNTLRVSQSRIQNEKLEYQMVCTRPDITSTGVDMLDGFNRGVQTNVQVFVDFDYAMRISITDMSRLITWLRIGRAGSLKANLKHMEALSTTEAGYVMFNKAWKKEIWLNGLLTESIYELRLVAGIATGTLVKGCSRFEVPAQRACRDYSLSIENFVQDNMSRDVITVGSTMRIPLLYRGEYSQWRERFMNYLEKQTDGEAMINSIQNGLSNDIYSLIDSNETAKDLWDALERQMRGSEYGEQDMKAAILYEYETFKATEGEQFLDTYLRYLQVINDLKKCGYKKDNCELNYKFLNNLQPEWKQYGTLMRQTKNLMDINIDALYNILKQNQGDVNDALGYKKKVVVVTSDPLALVAKKMKVTKPLLAKAFNRKKYYAKPTNNNLRTSSASSSANKKLDSDSDQEINANMVFMAKMEKVLSDSDESSSSAKETIVEVAYYTSESGSESEYENS